MTALTWIPNEPSSSAIFRSVFRVHFSRVIGSPAVSYSSSFSIRAITSGVFFPRVYAPPLVRGSALAPTPRPATAPGLGQLYEDPSQKTPPPYDPRRNQA